MERLGLEGRDRSGGDSVVLGAVDSDAAFVEGLLYCVGLVDGGGRGRRLGVRWTAPMAPGGGGPPMPPDIDIKGGS
jgi:hypothetical protein